MFTFLEIFLFREANFQRVGLLHSQYCNYVACRVWSRERVFVKINTDSEKKLKYVFSALPSTTGTQEPFQRLISLSESTWGYWATRCILVIGHLIIKRQLFSRNNITSSKETEPWKTRVNTVNIHSINSQVWVTLEKKKKDIIRKCMRVLDDYLHIILPARHNCFSGFKLLKLNWLVFAVAS